jgi:DNA primase
MIKQQTTTEDPFEAVKAEVTIEQYLHDHGVELRHGRARCPVHGGDNPQSFSVDSEKQAWHCFRCLEGGSVLDLCQRLEGGGVWEAMMTLATRYNVDRPERGQRWRGRQDAKGEVRDVVTEHLARLYQRRLTRVYAPLVLLGGESPGEKVEALEELSSALWPVSRNLARRRVNDEQ